jgi:hypothetical protein
MPYQKKLIINELLVRYDESGKFSGAHCKHIEQMVDLDTGDVYSTKELNLQPLEIDSDEFKEIISQVLNDTLATLTIRDAEIAQLNAEIAQLNAEIASQ